MENRWNIPQHTYFFGTVEFVQLLLVKWVFLLQLLDQESFGFFPLFFRCFGVFRCLFGFVACILNNIIRNKIANTPIDTKSFNKRKNVESHIFTEFLAKKQNVAQKISKLKSFSSNLIAVKFDPTWKNIAETVLALFLNHY